jgi:hypothetical protein
MNRTKNAPLVHAADADAAIWDLPETRRAPGRVAVRLHEAIRDAFSIEVAPTVVLPRAVVRLRGTTGRDGLSPPRYPDSDVRLVLALIE